jgi:two-component system, sensor histidine kinase PdtaS
MKLKFILSAVLLLLTSQLIAQVLNEKKIDSLQLQLIKKNYSSLEKAIIYNQLAEEYQDIEPEKSFKLLDKGLPILKKNNFSKGFADYYRISGKLLLNQGQYKKAIHNSEEASKIYLKLKDTANYLTNLYCLARATKEVGNIDKAIQTAIHGTHFSSNPKFSYEIGVMYFELCFYYNVKDDVYKALLYVDKAEKAFSKSSKKLMGLSKCYQQRSQIYTKTNKHTKAIQYAEKAIQIANELKSNKNVFSILYTTIGMAYFNIDDNKNAVKYLKRANEINKNNGSINRRAFNLVMLSQAYYGLKMYKDAIQTSQNAIALVDDKENLLMAYGIIGNSYYELKNYTSALINQNKALQLLNFVEDTDHQRSIFLELSKTYSQLGDFKNAYKNLNKFKDLEINFLTTIQEKNINELEIKFDSKQKDLALKELTISKQQQTLEILKQKNFNLILFFLIGFSIIITGIVLLTLFNNKKKNKLLNDKNEIISDKIVFVEEQKIELSKSLQERELLLKEIHHRVKNNLQIIMSLLNIQASKGEDISIENFLEKAQSRIASMSLIHQSLYENETLDSIDFNVYINQLAVNLIHLFGIEDKKIQLEITAKEIYLDLQTSISLGLILNELFTNALKYAFTDFKNAKISVSIETDDNEEFNLIFSDNGNGYLEKNNSKKSLGLELIELLALQLGGSIEKQNSKGTKYFMNFKKQI